MRSVAEDIAEVLQADVGLAIATDLFVSEMPHSPDRCVGVYDTGGFDPEPGYSYERPTFQVRIRGDREDGYRDAYELARSVREALGPLVNRTVDGTRYVAVWSVGDVNFLSYDDNHRPLFTLNFRAHRTA